MKVVADPGIGPAAGSATPAAAAAASSRVSTPPPSPAPAPPKENERQTSDTLAASLEAPVTFTLNRDASGRIYYVVTNAQTGQEIGQLPPEELRNVGDGIAEYVKQQEAKSAANQHIEVKA